MKHSIIGTMSLVFRVATMLILVILMNSAYSQITQVWADRYNGDGNLDQGLAITSDDTANVYVTGISSFSGSLDAYTIKYDAMGNIDWAVRYNGSGSGTDWCEAIAVDKSGNVYVAGKETSSSNGEDALVIKYNAAGTQQWVKTYNLSTSNDQAYDLAVDTSGNVYICGRATNSSGNFDFFIVKYNSSGTLQWDETYDGTGMAADQANAIVVSNSGNSYITGPSNGGGNKDDYVTIKYNSSGVQQWVIRYNGSANDVDKSYDIVLDASENVYVIGESQTSNAKDYAMIKYDSGGTQLLFKTYNHSSNNIDQGYAIAVDASGNIYATGQSLDASKGYDYATVKWNSSGVQQWVSRYDGGNNLIDVANQIAVTSNGDVYVSGYSNITGTGADYCIIKYNGSGAQQWVERYAGPVATDKINSMYVHDGGNVMVTGVSEGTGTGNDYYTISYCNIPTANAGADTGICSGNSVQINASGGINYAWWPTTGLSNPNIANPVATPTVTTAYQLTVTNGVGCWALDTITITVTTKPTANAGSNATICEGDSTQLSGSSGATYSWSPTTGLSDPNIANPWAMPTTSTTYSLTVSNGPGCDDTASVTITVNPLPVAGFTFVVNGDSVDFTDASTNAMSWSWDFGDGSSLVTTQNATHTYATDSSYTVCLSVTNSCAFDSTCKSVITTTTGIMLGAYNFIISVHPNPVRSGSSIYIYGLNDVTSLQTTFELYDITGRMVFMKQVDQDNNVTGLENLRKGIYLFKILQDEKAVHAGKLAVY